MEEQIFKGLAHIAIHTDKYEEVMRFYTEVFPGEVMGDLYLDNGEVDPTGGYPMKNGQVRLANFYIEILESKDKRNFNGITGSWHHIGIMVSDVEKAVEYLLAHGLPANRVGKIGKGLINPHPICEMKNCCIIGPSGERINLYEKDNAIYEDKKFVSGKYMEYLESKKD